MDAPPSLWLFVTLVAVLFAVVVAATTERRRVGLLLVGGTLLALLCWRWVDEMAGPERFSGHAVIPHLFAVAVAIVAVRPGRASPNDVDDRWRRAEDLAVVAATAVAWASLVAGADRLSRFGDVSLSPAPVYALLAVDVAIALLVAIRGGWTWLVPAAAAGAVLLGVSWRGLFGTAEAGVLGLAYTAVVTTFLAAAVRGGAATGAGLDVASCPVAHRGADRPGDVLAVLRPLDGGARSRLDGRCRCSLAAATVGGALRREAAGSRQP